MSGIIFDNKQNKITGSIRFSLKTLSLIVGEVKFSINFLKIVKKILEAKYIFLQ